MYDKIVEAMKGRTSVASHSRSPSAAVCLYVYAGAWALVLVAYQLSWMADYGPLDPALATFLVSTIVVSVGVAVLLQRRDSALCESGNDAVAFGTDPAPSARMLLVASLAICFGFILDFGYEGSIPLVLEVTSGYQHASFQGIPTLHVLLVTGTTFLMVLRADLAIVSVGAERRAHVAHALLLITPLFLLVNRGAIGACLIACGVVYVMRRPRNRARSLVMITSGAAVALYLFGGVGNRRWGTFGDDTYIRTITRVTGNFPRWVPGEYLWGYSYIVSPTGNLNYAIRSSSPEGDYVAYLMTLFPDFIINRIGFQFSEALPRPMEYFNVFTMFAGGWQYLGYLGMATTFLMLVGLVLLIRAWTHPPYQVAAFALLSVVSALSIFTNTLSYSGISFTLVFPVVASQSSSLAALSRRAASRVSWMSTRPSDVAPTIRERATPGLAGRIRNCESPAPSSLARRRLSGRPGRWRSRSAIDAPIPKKKSGNDSPA